MPSLDRGVPAVGGRGGRGAEAVHAAGQAMVNSGRALAVLSEEALEDAEDGLLVSLG